MSDNANLNRARRARDDEFRTRLADVEAELAHHPGAFEGRAVCCPADDPSSAFVRYFSDGFDRLGPERLEATCFSPGVQTRLDGSVVERSRPVRLTMTRDGTTVVPLEGDGDFRSRECRDVIASCDVVVTNPPFSLFRAMLSLLDDLGKDFILLGPQSAALYKEVFPRIMDGSVRLGVNHYEMTFDTPEGPTKLNSVAWFTTLEPDVPHDPLPPGRAYDPAVHPRYRELDAVEVPRLEDMPVDYDGLMGVPVTYLLRHDPSRFRIEGCAGVGRTPRSLAPTLSVRRSGRVERLYKRVIIRRLR